MNEAPKSPYFSFLICDHGEIVNLYFNGMPLGTIKAGTFHPHEFPTPSGDKRPITINDLPEPCPFKDFDQLSARISLAALHLFVMTPKRSLDET